MDGEGENETTNVKIDGLWDRFEALAADLKDDHGEILPPPRPTVEPLHHCKSRHEPL